MVEIVRASTEREIERARIERERETQERTR
jgi:hypothetical protein